MYLLEIADVTGEPRLLLCDNMKDVEFSKKKYIGCKFKLYSNLELIQDGVID